MTTITIEEELSQAIERMAAQRHKAVDQFVHDALLEIIEDYQDSRIAETVLANIESNKSQLLGWRNVKNGL